MKKVVALSAVLLFLLCVGAGYHYLSYDPQKEFIARLDHLADQPFEFHARIVDEEGKPVRGAAIDFKVFRYNQAWSRGIRSTNDMSADYVAQKESDDQGRIIFSGFGRTFFVTKVALPGFTWLRDKDGGIEAGYPMGDGTNFATSPTGDPD